MNRKNSAAVLELEQERPGSGGLHPGAVMIGSVVIADAGVAAANRESQVVVQRILQQVPFDIHAEIILRAHRDSVYVVRTSLEDDFAKESKLLGYVRSHEEV